MSNDTDAIIAAELTSAWAQVRLGKWIQQRESNAVLYDDDIFEQLVSVHRSILDKLLQK